jgi:hypothetical protein
LFALGLFGAALGLYEAFWRSRGFAPSVADTAELWGAARDKVRAGDPDQVVLIGTSRMRQGVDPDEFARAFGGHPPAELAIDGSDCRPVLRHLASDESFRGVIVCEVHPLAFFMNPSVGLEEQYLKKYEARQSPLPAIEQRLRQRTQEALVSRREDLALRRLLSSLWVHRRLPQPFRVSLPDRSERADYTKVSDLIALSNYWAGAYDPIFPLSRQELLNQLDATEELVSRTHHRGGRVVFVRFPSSGAVRAIEDQLFPRPRYWDVLAARTEALAIHYLDYPTLRTFECPDGSHLDQRDVPAFTGALAACIKEKLQGCPVRGQRVKR